MSEEYLLRPGDQDLTAHVDFSAVRRAAERVGGRCLGLTTQARFLLALGAIEFLGEQGLPGDGPRVAGPADRVRRFREREALKELVLPDRMGDRFRVMVLSAGEAPGDLTGLLAPWASPARAARFAAPALSPALQAQSRS